MTTSEISNLLQGKIVVITGGAGLLGRQFCSAVAHQGGVAIVADVNREAADKVAHNIVAEGGQAVGRTLDITCPDAVSELIDDLHAQYGGIDAVVNNAYPKNQNYGRRFEEVQYSDICESLCIHLAGYFLVAQKFAEYFKINVGGNIVNMSSIYGCMPPRFQIYEGTVMTMPVEYALIKSGVLQLTKYIAQYYKGEGIRCNAISSGGIADKQPESFIRKYGEFCASKGMLDPQDIEGALIFLISEKSKYINGQNIIVDDGYSL